MWGDMPRFSKLRKGPNFARQWFREVVVVHGAQTRSEALSILRKWKRLGGVCVIGYETLVALLRVKKGAPRAEGHSFKTFLQRPGPDLVICDEGHRLRNLNSQTTQVIRRHALMCFFFFSLSLTMLFSPGQLEHKESSC